MVGHTFFPRHLSPAPALASALRGGRGPAEDTPPRDRGPAAAGPSPTGQRRHHTPS
ncbi:hypothetical protein ABZV34_15420 [Streptomyces sp. NPDC005195]|uniref:hypothetical protein n=1 Tax=Streptomyces sp. NPDC005195 TaxID=3154561 RepID=UPI0033AFC31E